MVIVREGRPFVVTKGSKAHATSFKRSTLRGRLQQTHVFTDFSAFRDNLLSVGNDALQRIGKQLEPFPSDFPPGGHLHHPKMDYGQFPCPLDAIPMVNVISELVQHLAMPCNWTLRLWQSLIADLMAVLMQTCFQGLEERLL